MKHEVRFLILFTLLIARILVGGVVNIRSCPPGKTVRLKGVVSEVLRSGENKQLQIGRALVPIEPDAKFSRLDNLSLVGTCHHGLIGFFTNRFVVESKLITKLGTVTTQPSVLDKFHEKVSGLYKRSLPQNEAGLLAGMVIGEKAAIPWVFYQQLTNSGLVHLVVASGYNVSLVIGGVLMILSPLMKKKWSVIAAVAAAWMYVLLTGGQPPVLRAFVMATLVLLSGLLGKLVKAGDVLLVTVWSMLMWDPDFLTSVSFQLSFAATAGLVWIEPFFKKRFRQWGRIGKVFTKLEVSVTIGAMLATLPVVWWHFGRINPVGLITNTLVVPLIAPVMILGLLMVPVGLISPVVAQVIAWLLYPMLHFVTVVALMFGD